jgi:hypothetical protein
MEEAGDRFGLGAAVLQDAHPSFATSKPGIASPMVFYRGEMTQLVRAATHTRQPIRWARDTMIPSGPRT